MQKRGLTESFNSAIEGLVYAVKTQRNLRVHGGIGLGVLLVSILAGVSRIEFLILVLTIAFVLTAELFNTAVELVIDMTKDQSHPVARASKDVAAGAVLVATLNAVGVGCLIFANRFEGFLEGTLEQVRFVPWQVSFVVLILVCMMVIIIKLFFHRGTPFLGGMPSGHAAVAFSLWTLVGLIQSNLLVTTLAFILALLAAWRRIRAGFHTWWESTAGAFLGCLVTLIIVKLLGL